MSESAKISVHICHSSSTVAVAWMVELRKLMKVIVTADIICGMKKKERMVDALQFEARDYNALTQKGLVVDLFGSLISLPKSRHLDHNNLTI